MTNNLPQPDELTEDTMTDPGPTSPGPTSPGSTSPVEDVTPVEGVGRGLALTGEVLELITRRIILEAFQESSASWWDHRAATFDRVGTVTGDETADLCRTHAGLLRELGVPDAAADLTTALQGLIAAAP